ncbi:RNA 2'-phosphotransferase [Akkermansiaceae bacterium]|nr:RNA 2'-phosphotransferase [Akkermansiaceae bacterium]
MSKFDKKVSRILSLVLRHDPKSIGLTLDENGWVPLADLVTGLQKDGKKIDQEIVERVVANSDQQRFAISEDGLLIRANQGHSVDVKLELEEKEPPTWLFHGTSLRALTVIEGQGIHKQERDYVHLSADQSTARKCAQRKGKPVVIEVASKLMHKNGHVFYQADNGVWLTDHIPPDYMNKRAKLY